MSKKDDTLKALQDFCERYLVEEFIDFCGDNAAMFEVFEYNFEPDPNTLPFDELPKNLIDTDFLDDTFGDYWYTFGRIVANYLYALLDEDMRADPDVREWRDDAAASWVLARACEYNETGEIVLERPENKGARDLLHQRRRSPHRRTPHRSGQPRRSILRGTSR